MARSVSVIVWPKFLSGSRYSLGSDPYISTFAFCIRYLQHRIPFRIFCRVRPVVYPAFELNCVIWISPFGMCAMSSRVPPTLKLVGIFYLPHLNYSPCAICAKGYICNCAYLGFDFVPITPVIVWIDHIQWCVPYSMYSIFLVTMIRKSYVCMEFPHPKVAKKLLRENFCAQDLVTPWGH